MDARKGRFLLVVFVSVLMLLMLAGCAGGGSNQEEQGTQESTGAAATTGSFVGEVSGPQTYVAIVADEPVQQGSDQREVRAYVSDGQSVSEWFDGSVTGNEANLTSESGRAQLAVTLDPETPYGSVTLSDGQNLPFKTATARGVGGLYDVSISGNSQVTGASERGGRVEGRLGQQAADGSYPISGTFTSPGGSQQDFNVSVASAPQDGDYRWIVMSNGRFKGAKKDASTGSSEGFLSPIST